MRLLTLLASSLVAVTVVSAQGPGIVIVQQETRGGKVTTSLMQIDKTHMRTETGGTTAMIFDGEAQVARILNMERKTYTEMTKAQLQQMGQQMAQAMEQLKNMPPEQKAMMEKMMARAGRGMPGMSTAPITYRAAGSDKAGQWSCTKYEGMREQQKVVELCTVDPKAIGLTLADFDVTRQMAEFFKNAMPQLTEQLAIIGTQTEQGYSGFPIRTTSFSNGQVQSISELKEVKREPIPASTWQVPAGFKLEGRGRGGRP